MRPPVSFSAFRRPLSVCAILLCLSLPAAAQSSLDHLVGQRIDEVRLVLEGRPIDDVDISRVLETQAGMSLTTSAVRESIVHLMALSRFQDVRVSAEEAQQGVRLTYELLPLRSVKGVEFRGDVVLPARQLRSEVLNRYGSSPPASRAQEMARVLEAYYHDRGFLTAAVRPVIEAPPGAKYSTLFLDVTPGPRVAIGSVDVQGAPGGSGPAVAQRLGLVRGQPFDAAALRERTASYVDSLRTQGYIEAKVEVEPGYSGDGNSIDVTVRMNRGPHVTRGLRRGFAAGVPEGRTGRHPPRGYDRRGHAGERAAEPRVRVAGGGIPRRGSSLRPRGARPGRDPDCLQDPQGPAVPRGPAGRDRQPVPVANGSSAAAPPGARAVVRQIASRERRRDNRRALQARWIRQRQGAAERHRRPRGGHPRCPVDGDRGDEDARRERGVQRPGRARPGRPARRHAVAAGNALLRAGGHRRP